MAPVLYDKGLASSQSTGSVMDTLPSLVSIGCSLPLLPRKLIQQIKAGEFIDFAELPPAKGRQITPANYNTLCIASGHGATAEAHTRLLDMVTVLCHLYGSSGSGTTPLYPRTCGLLTGNCEMHEKVQVALLGYL